MNDYTEPQPIGFNENGDGVYGNKPDDAFGWSNGPLVLGKRMLIVYSSDNYKNPSEWAWIVKMSKSRTKVTVANENGLMEFRWCRWGFVDASVKAKEATNKTTRLNYG